MEAAKTVTLQMTPFAALWDALPAEQRTDTIHGELLAAYRRELHALLDAGMHPGCEAPCLVLRPWRQAGAQWICEFWAADTAQERTGRMNFHGQDTSRWRYGGAIVLQDGEVSTHH